MLDFKILRWLQKNLTFLLYQNYFIVITIALNPTQNYEVYKKNSLDLILSFKNNFGINNQTNKIRLLNYNKAVNKSLVKKDIIISFMAIILIIKQKK